MSSRKPTLAFVDLETTGLSAQLDVPLELGIILTDDWGSEIASASWLVREWGEDFESSMERGHSNEFVHPMHTKSGLWYDLEKKICFSRSEVDNFAVAFMEAWNVKPGILPMVGNSIGSLDRPFSLIHFPKFNEFLSYRNIDISSFKEVCKRLNPGLWENIEPIVGTKENATHRVLGDCRACIKEYQTYLDEFLIVGD